jgi:RES domain-containing protein
MRRRIERYRAIFETLGQPARGSIFRGVPLKHQRSPLSAIGSINKGGRYNEKGAFEMLYFANDGDTVLRETRIVKYDAGGGPITVPTRAYVLISLHYDVSYLVDLTDADVQEALKLDDNVLRGEWEVDILNGKKPLTQDIGHAARAAGIEAIIVPSARNPGYKNTNFIVDQLLETSSIRIHDTDGFEHDAVVNIRGTKKKRTDT